MGIVKVDGRMFLDSGTVIVSGDANIEIEIDRSGFKHQVALKFRTAGADEPDVRVGNPHRGRTVIHLINFEKSETSTADFVGVGEIFKEDRKYRLRLSYVIRNFLFAERGDVWWLTYSLYAEDIANG
jgi:hypothetical protein